MVYYGRWKKATDYVDIITHGANVKVCPRCTGMSWSKAA